MKARERRSYLSKLKKEHLKVRDLKKIEAGVRKLKALGLTISLEVGYRLSAKGDQVLNAIEQRNA